MALLPSNKELKRKQIEAKDIKVDDDVEISYTDKKFKAKDRVPVQLDPPVKETIGNIAYVKDIPMYKVVELAADAYLNTLTDTERNIYDSRK